MVAATRRRRGGGGEREGGQPHAPDHHPDHPSPKKNASPPPADPLADLDPATRFLYTPHTLAGLVLGALRRTRESENGGSGA